MAMITSGFDELMKQLNDLSANEMNNIAQPVVKSIAKQIKSEMVQKAPYDTSQVNKEHGIDYIKTVSYTKKGIVGSAAGLRNIMEANSWDITRGLWFTNFVTSSPNFGWWFAFTEEMRGKYEPQFIVELDEALAARLKSR